MPNERQLRALLRFGLDERTLKETEDGVLSVEDALERVEKQAEQTEKRMQLLREAADVGGQIADGFLGASAAISGPLLLSMNSYVQHAGRAERASSDWLDQTERLRDAQLRIGRVVAEQALPFLERAARLAEEAAQFVEAHPEAIKAALNVAGVLAALGVAGRTAAQVARFTADVGELLAKARTAAVGQAAAAGAGTGAAGIGGVGLPALVSAAGAVAAGVAAAGVVVGIVNQVLEKTGVAGEIREAQERIRATGRFYPGAPGLARPEDVEAGVPGAPRERAVRSQAEADEAKRAAEEAQAAFEEQLDAYIQFVEDSKAAEEQYEEDRQGIIDRFGVLRTQAEDRYEGRRDDIVNAHGQRRTQMTADFARREEQTAENHQRTLLKNAQDFTRTQAEAEAQYYQQRSQRAAQFGIEAQRVEEDHQRDLERLRRGFERSQRSAEIDRDAIALIEAREGYEEQRQEAEDSFGVQAERRAEDFAREAAQMEANFRAQQESRAVEFKRRQDELQAEFERERAVREEDFARRQAELDLANADRLTALDEQHTEEQQRLEDQGTESLTALDQQYTDEKSERDQAFRGQLGDLGLFLGNERQARQQHYAAMQRDFEGWMRGMRAAIPTSRPGARDVGAARQAGGYAPDGVYRLGERGREFVMAAGTTRTAERAVGGALTQENMLRALEGGGRGGISLSVQMANDFSNVSGADIGRIEAMLARNNAALETEIVRRLATVMGT